MEGSEDAYVGYMTIKVSTELEPEELAVYQRCLSLLVPSQGSTVELCSHSGESQGWPLVYHLFIAEDKIIIISPMETLGSL